MTLDILTKVTALNKMFDQSKDIVTVTCYNNLVATLDTLQMLKELTSGKLVPL